MIFMESQGHFMYKTRIQRDAIALICGPCGLALLEATKAMYANAWITYRRKSKPEEASLMNSFYPTPSLTPTQTSVVDAHKEGFLVRKMAATTYASSMSSACNDTNHIISSNINFMIDRSGAMCCIGYCFF